MQFFEETLANLKHVFKVAPRVAAYDLHPGYMSTRMAMASGIEHKIGVQHHHAHIASCMAENHLQGKVLGVALDGTGFGTDGRIWGGEFLLADFAGFTRRAHLRNVLLPGGDAAVRQPWRMALSYLRDAFGQQIPSRPELFPGDRREAGCPGGHYAHAADSDGGDVVVRTALRCRRCAVGFGLGGDLRGPGSHCAGGGGRSRNRRALRLRDSRRANR